ncbi:MAG: polysaccharide pyruvyl transferase family protein [Clostridia bacterium]|nr:polysaccharide pyruvyl transferase family protein [Clostridia bacterium]
MDNLHLYYYDYPNFGDQLSVALLREVFHCSAQAAPYTTADAVAIGSILDAYFDETTIPKRLAAIRPEADASRPVHVWGTGMMWPYQTALKPLRPLRIHALRGPLTQRQVEKSLGISLACPLGDAGLLAPMLLSEKPVQKHRVGIVPHYVEKDEPLVQKMLSFYEDSVLIDVQEETRDVVRKIAECEVIFSTSLHGLIVANSFGIPSQWCRLTDRILGNGYKYHDYYQSFGMDRNPLILAQDPWPSPEAVRKSNAIPLEMVLQKQQALMDAGTKMLIECGLIRK